MNDSQHASRAFVTNLMRRQGPLVSLEGPVYESGDEDDREDTLAAALSSSEDPFAVAELAADVAALFPGRGDRFVRGILNGLTVTEAARYAGIAPATARARLDQLRRQYEEGTSIRFRQADFSHLHPFRDALVAALGGGVDAVEFVSAILSGKSIRAAAKAAGWSHSTAQCRWQRALSSI